jgi:hypothetical protein
VGGVSAPALTEADVLALLRRKHTKDGNGGSGEYAFLTHVRNAAGFDANRTIDAIAVSLWPSRGLVIDAFEVKVSRADWQRELADPKKAGDICQIVDRFWIVAPAGVVRAGELPPTWGLIEVTGGKPIPAAQPALDGAEEVPIAVTGRRLRTVKAAPLLHGEQTRQRTISRDLLVGMLRAAEGAIPKPKETREVAPAEIQAAYARGREEGTAGYKAKVDEWRQIAQQAQAAMLAFENASGVRLRDSGSGYRSWTPTRLEEVGHALRAVLNEDQLVKGAQQRLAEVARALRNEADRVEHAGRW